MPLADFPKRSGYGQRVVAIVDILGASHALYNSEYSRRFSEALAAILSPIIREKQEPWLVLPHIWTGEEVEIEHPRPISTGTRFTTISDSFVISIPCGSRLKPAERVRNAFACVHAVARLQRSLLTLGLRTRGGLTIGGLIHKNHLIVGEALVRAHEIESKIAKYPRTVIDSAVIDLLIDGPFPKMALFKNRVAHNIRQDTDGLYFVDYFTSDPILGSFGFYNHLLEIWRNIEKDLISEEDNKIIEKLTWMKEYILSVGEYSKTEYPIKSHAELRFSSVYPRTADNLKTWVDSVTSEKANPKSDGEETSLG